MHLLPSVAIQPNLELKTLKTRPKQFVGSLPLVIALPARALFGVPLSGYAPGVEQKKF